MPLWGANKDSEKIPTWLTDEQKRNCYVDDRGWILRNPEANTEEILVAIGGLAGSNSSTGFANANIMEVVIGSRDNAESNFVLNVYYNEKVIVDTSSGLPFISISANTGTLAGNGQAIYLSGNNSNHLVFRYIPQSSDNATTVSIGGQIVVNSATLVDESNTDVSVSLTKAGADSNTDVTPDTEGFTIVKA